MKTKRKSRARRLRKVKASTAPAVAHGKVFLSLVLLVALCWIPAAPAPTFRAIQLDMAEVCDEYQTKYSYGVCSEFPGDHANLLDIPEPLYGPWAPCLENDFTLEANFIAGA